MKLTLQRTSPTGHPMTFGKLFADGQFICYTLQDACVILGFAVLIVRTRFKEHL